MKSCMICGDVIGPLYKATIREMSVTLCTKHKETCSGCQCIECTDCNKKIYVKRE